MKTFKKQAAQGDIFIRRIYKLPANVVKHKPEGETHIVAHSETGHHHTLPSTNVALFTTTDPLISFIIVTGEAELKHHRPHDTHESLKLLDGKYEIRRQQEYTPEGWRRVAD
jgi:hypothetical protein